jgi:hypothetical protein
MALEKRDQDDEGNWEKSSVENQAAEENPSAEGPHDAAASPEPNEAEGSEARADLQVTDPSVVGRSPADNGVWEITAGLGFPLPLPPPVNLPDLAVASVPDFGAVPETGGVSISDFMPDPGVASAVHDLVERRPGTDSPEIESPILAAPELAGPLVPGDPVEPSPGSREGASRPVTLPPNFAFQPGGEIRVAKRLMIEVEVTIVNAERVSRIATHDARGEFKQLADASVYKVARDLRTFRESYRRAWDWKHI